LIDNICPFAIYKLRKLKFHLTIYSTSGTKSWMHHGSSQAYQLANYVKQSQTLKHKTTNPEALSRNHNDPLPQNVLHLCTVAISLAGKVEREPGSHVH